jgi:hypothetical protein
LCVWFIDSEDIGRNGPAKKIFIFRGKGSFRFAEYPVQSGERISDAQHTGGSLSGKKNRLQ